MKNKSLFGFIPLMFCLSCSTFVTHTYTGHNYDPPAPIPSYGVYRGVRFDARCISGVDASVEGAVDMPFSAVGDTLLLPYDIVYSLVHTNGATGMGTKH